MAQGGLTGLQNALKDSTGRLAPVLLDGTKRRGGPVLSILSDHPEAQLIFARPINDHVHRTPRLGQWVLISGTWYQPLDRRLLGRAHLSPRRSHRLLDRRGRVDDLGRPSSRCSLTRICDTTGRSCGPAGSAGHTNAKSPGRSRGFPQLIGWPIRSRVGCADERATRPPCSS